MLGLKFKIDGVYFTTFRKPLSTRLILSYSVPPYTTIRGLVSNALGLKRDDYSVQDWMEIGIKPLIYSNKSNELAKILKLKDTGHRYEKKFLSSPVFKEFLVFQYSATPLPGPKSCFRLSPTCVLPRPRLP